MAVNRTKVLEAAQKFLSKGQYDKAVAEYQKLVHEDPRDVRTLLKIGDLHTRRSKPKDAIEVYQKVADLYAKQGFFLKGVAVYKQILKLDPAHLDTTQKLAKMYEELALTSDALATYELVADAYVAQGQVPKALEVMGRMIDLDGQNVAVRIKFAEALSKAGKPKDAAQAFAAGALLLKEQGRMDDYLRVVERQLYHDPENVHVARELAGLYLERSDPKRALAKLQVCFKADPRDVQTLEMLAESFRQLGQTAKTISVLKEIARLHAEAGSDEPRRRTLKRVLDLDPSDAEAKQALGTLKSSPAARPTAAPPRRPAPPPPPPAAVMKAPPPAPPASAPPSEELELEPEQELELLEEGEPDDVLIVDEPSASPALPSEEQRIFALLGEADAREGAGDYEGALSALQGVLALDANHVPAHERLKDIYIAADRRVDAVKELLWLSSSCEELNLDRAVQYARSAHELAPRSEATRRRLATLGVELPGQGAVLRAQRTPDLIDAELDEILPPVSEPPARNEATARSRARSTEAVADLLELPLRPDDFDAPVPVRRDARLSLEAAMELLKQPFAPEEFGHRQAVVSTPLPAEAVGDDAPSRQFAPVHTSEVSLSEQPPPQAAEPSITSVGSHPSDAPEPDLLALMRGRAAEPEHAREAAPDTQADPILEFGYAESTAQHDFPEPEDGPDATVPGGSVPEELLSHLDRDLPSATSATSLSSEPSISTEPPAREHEGAVRASAIAAQEHESGARTVEAIPPEVEEVLDEADFFASQGLLDEALDLVQESILIYPASAALKQRLAEYEAKADQKDEAEEQARVEKDDSFDIAEQLANGLVEVDSSDDGDDMVDIESVFAQFKKGVAQQIAPDDSETHFDLGIAYKEMGLLKDAVNEFELAAKGKKRACTALTMVGMCHLESGQTELAITYFEQALHNENRSSSEELALQYEIGSAYEKLGQVAEALVAFESVYAKDRGYRGVVGRIDQLRKHGKSAGAGR